MALLPATLADELIANLDNFTTEPEAAAAWADSFDTYFQSAMAGALPVAPLVTAGAKANMQSALSGMSADSAGSTSIVAGITAYWLALAATAATLFVAVPPATSITPPPGLSSLKSALDVNFLANSTGMVAKEAAITLIATTIHLTQVGGIAVFPPTPGGLGPLTIV